MSSHLLVLFLLLPEQFLLPAGLTTPPPSTEQSFFEINDTNGDLGNHALIDGYVWKTKDRKVIDNNVKERLRSKFNRNFFGECRA